jgi:hypothetical protein
MRAGRLRLTCHAAGERWRAFAPNREHKIVGRIQLRDCEAARGAAGRRQIFLPEEAAMALHAGGFVIPVPKKHIPAYLKMARLGGRIWKEHGALEVFEPGDDL